MTKKTCPLGKDWDLTVAAALEEAAKSLSSCTVWCDRQDRADDGWFNGVADAMTYHTSRIRALIPDAGDALDRALEKAREEGRREERDVLRNALLEVLAFRAQVAHGSVNLTALARAMSKAEDAIRARTTLAELKGEK